MVWDESFVSKYSIYSIKYIPYLACLATFSLRSSMLTSRKERVTNTSRRALSLSFSLLFIDFLVSPFLRGVFAYIYLSIYLPRGLCMYGGRVSKLTK